MTGSSAGSIRQLDRLSDRLRQQRQATPEASMLIVEGPTDAAVLSRVLDTSVLLFPASGRGNVVSTVDQLMQWGFGKFAGVIDRDFDDEVIEVALSTLTRLRAYVGRDLEAMLVLEGVAKDVVAFLGSAAKLATENVDDIILTCVAQASIVGRLRAASHKYGWGLAFDKVGIETKIDKDSLILNLQSYCAALAGSANPPVPQAQLLKVVEDEEGDSPSSGFSGKDFLAFIGVALRKRLGTADKSVCRPQHLASVLRLGGATALRGHDWTVELEQVLVTA